MCFARATALLLLLQAFILSACTMGPDYSQPDVFVPETFRTDGAVLDLTPIANLPWWDLLRDEQLQELIRTALRENQDLQKAAATVEEFQAYAMINAMDFVPQLSGTVHTPAFGRMSRFNVPGFPNPFNYYIQGNLAWEIDIWGRIRRSNEAARADLLAQEENRRAVILQLVSGVAQAYFDLRQLDMQLDIARQTVGTWEESVKIARVRLREGLVSKWDVDQVDAERANAAARTVELERLMVQKENDLSVLIGRNPQAIPRGVALTKQVMPPDVPAGLPSELLKRRPDIVHVERQLVAATARIGMAKADRFPKLSLTGIMGFANPQLSQLVKGGGRSNGAFGEVGPGLAAPLFNASVLGFRQQAVEAQAKQVLAEYKQAILVALREVENALIAVKTSVEQRAVQEQQVEALRSSLHIAHRRYKDGLANYLDILVARRNLFDAELALTETHRLYLVSIVQLYKALGGGWLPDGAYGEVPIPPQVREVSG